MNKLVSTERKMQRMMLRLKDRISSSEVAEKMGAELMVEWLRRRHFRWLWYVFEEGRIRKWV